MSLYSSTWQTTGTVGDNFVFVDEHFGSIYNAIALKLKERGTVFTGWGVDYQDTNEVDPKTGVVIVKVRRENRNDWHEESYRLNGDSLFWKTPNSSEFHEWRRIDLKEIPARAIQSIEGIRKRMG